MKELITNVSYVKEYETKFGKLHLHRIKYADKIGFYSSKKKEQTYFTEGQECEFTEEVQQGQNGEFIKLKPVRENKGFSNFSRALKKEQSRYSGFSDSYVKDLISSGILKPEKTDQDEEHNDIVMMTWKKRALEIFEHMVSLDKTLEQ